MILSKNMDYKDICKYMCAYVLLLYYVKVLNGYYWWLVKQLEHQNID